MEQNIRWQQRFSNYRKALKQLSVAIKIYNDSCNSDLYDNEINEIIQESVIKRFEYTHELAWKVMKDFLKYQGNNDIAGSRDATRAAFKINLFESTDNAITWMNMIKSRNLSTHTYDVETANDIAKLVVSEYHKLFLEFNEKMTDKIDGQQKDIFS